MVRAVSAFALSLISAVSANHELRELSWKVCPGHSAQPQLNVGLVEPLVTSGDKIGLMVSGENTGEEIQGGKVHMRMRYPADAPFQKGTVTINSKKDLCSVLGGACPVDHGGNFSAGLVYDVPEWAPSAPVKGTMEVKSEEGAVLLCLELSGRIVRGKSSQKQESEKRQTPKLEAGLLGMDWKKCGDGDRMDVKGASITPDPPVSGGDFQFAVNGNLADGEPITGGSIDLDFKYDRIIPYKKSIELCKALKDAGFSCPVNPGEIQIAAKTSIPKIVPAGSLKGTVKVKDSKGAQVMCLNVGLKVSKNKKHLLNEVRDEEEERLIVA